MKKTRASLTKKESFKGFLFTLPFVLGFIFFFLTPLLRSLVFSFSKLSLDSSIGMVLTNVAFKNYRQALFVDPDFVKTLLTSLRNLFINGISILIFSFIIANLLNQKFPGRTFARIIFFLPVIVTSGIIFMLQNDAVMSAATQAVSGGSTETSAQTLNLSGTILALLPVDTTGLVGFIKGAVDGIYNITVCSGVQIIIFLAGLQNISPALYEASSIEGASGWENFWKITLPMISPLIIVNTVYTIIDSFNGLSNQVIKSIYNTTFTSSNYGLSAAMSWIYILVIAVVLVVTILVINRFVFYDN